LRANPLRGWSISGSVTYIRLKIQRVNPTQQTYDLTAHPVPIVGNRFNFAPDWNGTVDTEYRFATAHDLEAFIGGGLQFASKSYSDLAQSSLSTLPGYVTLDARIGLESAQGWRVSMWSRNLTDKLYLTNVVSTGDTIARYTGLPRTFGLSFGFDF
jgi:iron complex outermembrane receptor protein